MRREQTHCGSARYETLGNCSTKCLFLIYVLVVSLVGASNFITNTNEISIDNNPEKQLGDENLFESRTSANTNNNKFQDFAKLNTRNNSSTTCSNGLLTFELSTGFIYTPTVHETLSMLPGTLQLTDCLDFCLRNSSCQAINFEMGLCGLLLSSVKQNPQNLHLSQYPVFVIYAEKICLLSGKL